MADLNQAVALPSRVQISAATEATINPVFGSTVPATSCIAVAFSANCSGGAGLWLDSVTDDQGNIYEVGNVQFFAGSGGYWGWAYLLNPTNAPRTLALKVKSTQAGTITLYACAYDIANASSVNVNLMDVHSASWSAFLDSFTTATDGECAIASLITNNSGITLTQNNGWTQDFRETYFGMICLHKSLPTAGTNSIDMTLSAAASTAIMIFTFTPTLTAIPEVLIVQQKPGDNGAGSAGTAVQLVITLDAPVASGNAIAVGLIADAAAGGQSCSLSQVTDDKGNSYSAPTSNYSSTLHKLTSCAVLLNATNAPQTITITVATSPSATVRIAAKVYELNNVLAASAVDRNSNKNVTTAATAYDWVFPVVAQGEFAFVAMGLDTTPESFNQNTGWTEALNAPSTLPCALFHTILSGTGSNNLNMTLSAAARSNAIIMTLKPSSGPSAAALAGDAADTISATGALTTAIRLAGAASDTVTASAALRAAAGFAGGATTATAATAALTTAIRLAGGALSTGTAAASLLTAIRLAASANDAIAAGANLTVGASVAGAAATSVTAAGTLTAWATVTLAEPLYMGVGGLLDPNFWAGTQPVAGSLVYYDPTHITIAVNGEISSDTNHTEAIVQFWDGSAMQIGLVTITPNLVGYAEDVTSAAGLLTAAIRLAGAASDAVTASGGLSTGIRLASAAANTTAAAAALTTAIKLAGAAITTTAAGGDLDSGALMAGAATDTTTATGALSTAIMLSGAAADLITAGAGLTTAIRLAANALTSTLSTGELLGGAAALAGDAADTSLAGALLTTGILLTGAALDLSSASAQMTTGINLAGAALDTVTAGGVLAQPALLQSIVYQAIRALLAGQVYPHVAPDSAVPPYAIYQVVASSPENTLANGVPIDNDRYQIDTYSRTYLDAVTTAKAVRDALVAIPYPLGVVFTMQAEQYEPEVKLYRIIQDFSVWNPRAN